MEDFPAGPASPGSRRVSLCIVIPVRNGGRDFERCLRGLHASSRADFELIVIDDGSTDGSGALAATFGARVHRNDTPLGPAAARNTGVGMTRADVIFFVDADVVVHGDAVAKVTARFDAEPDLAALFGSYDDSPADPGVVSRFRNLLHHFVHQSGKFVDESRPAHTFWTGCGAIRREAFLAVGGFDPRLYRRPAIEDIELGYRLTRAGRRVALVRDIQASHLKRWTLRSMVYTDIFQRGVPWMLLLLRSHTNETDLNVSHGQRLSVAAMAVVLLGLTASIFAPAALGIVALALATIFAINRQLYAFLAKRHGILFACRGFALHFVYFLCCGTSVALALGMHHVLNRRRGAAFESRRRARIDGPAAPQPSRRARKAAAAQRRAD